MQILLKAGIIVNHYVTLIVRYFIHFYGIFCVDDTSDVLRNDSGDDLSLGLDMGERPSEVDSLGKQLDGEIGSKLKRTGSGNVGDLVEL